MSSKKTVYLVRHGQSEDNTAPVFQSYGSPLSSKGLEQASDIARRIANLDFEALVASPQPRARQTAEAIARTTGKDIESSDLFVERIKPASVDGKPWADKEANALYRTWNETLVTSGKRLEDGENYDDIVGRASKALDYLLTRDESSLVVVSHGHFIRTLVAQVLLGPSLSGDTLRRIYDLTSLENTAITVLQYADAYEEDYCWRLWTMNDHAHFAE